MVLKRLSARAWLEDPGDEVARVRRAVEEGDESWERWLDELESGAAVLASMCVTAVALDADGTTSSVRTENHNLWLEVETHPPLLEGQIHELSGKDCAALAQQLSEMGMAITADDLSDMYVHIELDESLLQAMPRDAPVDHTPQTRLGIATERGLEAKR